jgi:hypothetical protein
MDGRGRPLDDFVIEPVWQERGVRETLSEGLRQRLGGRVGTEGYIRFYCERRAYRSLGNRSPAESSYSTGFAARRRLLQAAGRSHHHGQTRPVT